MACVICGASAAVLRGYGDWMVDKTESFTRLDMMKSWSGKWVCFQPWASNDFEVAYFLTKPYPTEVIIRVRLKFGGYPLVNSHITMGRSTMLCSWLNQHKSTISMAIFNSKLWMFTRPGSPIHGITLWKIMASRWCQTMGFYMNFPGQNGLLKLTGDWCHVYFHAKKSQLSS